MKILVASDLHFEFHPDAGVSFVEGMPAADVLVCPGDLTNAAGIWDALLLLLRKYPHVVFTYGNHEFYGSNIPAVKSKVEKLKQRLPTLGEAYGILHVLDNSTCEIEGQRFVGTTLWFRKVEDSWRDERSLNDFYEIANAHQRIYEENAKAIDFLSRTVGPHDIVLTHHLPSPRSVHACYAGSPLNKFFVCDLTKLIEHQQPKLWVHGHTHVCCDYLVGTTRVLCNPYGYMDYDVNPDFNENLIVEI